MSSVYLCYLILYFLNLFLKKFYFLKWCITLWYRQTFFFLFIIIIMYLIFIGFKIFNDSNTKHYK